MGNLKREFGKHYIVELIGCNPEKIKYAKYIKKILLEAAARSKTKVLESFFHQFEPFGVTGMINISWSHFAFHSWPEENYAALDIFTCGEMDPKAAIQYLKKILEAKEAKIQVISRGF